MLLGLNSDSRRCSCDQQDLDQASRIAYGQDRRWRRVVTLKVGLAACGLVELDGPLFLGSASLASSFADTQPYCLPQGEMINESGTMTGGGGKPRGGRMCIGSGAPKSVDPRAAEAELQVGCPQWPWNGVAHSFLSELAQHQGLLRRHVHKRP